MESRWPPLFDVDTLVNSFGLLGILAIVFMETGLLIGFVFPGDTLLFTAGIMAHAENPFAPLWVLLIGIPLAAILGDQLGFLIGRRYGPRALDSQAMRWIGPEAVERTNHFFDRFGPATVTLARFVAVVRTVTPVVAGFSSMAHRTFTFYSVIGSVLWGAGVTSAGYLLGEVPVVQEYMHWVIVVGVSLVLFPMLIKTATLLRRSRRAVGPQPGKTDTPGAPAPGR
ncbi:DedA family protein [Corynebacterium sp. TAE3-ERU16]|uniref:DedA family protein n=1 Tax=Corynebacterium sp. TAE3-ERU16 TaxID=2849493 RepID=UPI002107F1D7|nr:DedA family protein [Corynebacterium sp. TAE3-ERU16]